MRNLKCLFEKFKAAFRLVCIPLDIVKKFWCQDHKKVKENIWTAFQSFHKYPDVIVWRVKNYYVSANAFENENDLLGIKLFFHCANRKDLCMAEKTMRSLAVEKHDSNVHVIFEERFTNSKMKDNVCLNHHLHACGSILEKFHIKKDREQCCIFKVDDLPTEYREIPKKLNLPLEKTPKATNEGPISIFMNKNLENYEKNPLQAQIAPRTVTYNKAKHAKKQAMLTERPWLSESDTNLDTISRVIKLKEYIDKECLKRENRSMKKRKFPYFIETTIIKPEGFGVIITDLIGLKLFQQATKNGSAVIGLDATGLGKDGDDQIFWYALKLKI